MKDKRFYCKIPIVGYSLMQKNRAISRNQAGKLYDKGRDVVVEVIVLLSEEVINLRTRLNQNSKNSSLPPSKDPITAKIHPMSNKPSGRKPGGQPGHTGTQRSLLPIEMVDTIVVVKPTHCLNCHRHLEGEDLEPRRHQIVEIPPVAT